MGSPPPAGSICFRLIVESQYHPVKDSHPATILQPGDPHAAPAFSTRRSTVGDEKGGSYLNLNPDRFNGFARWVTEHARTEAVDADLLAESQADRFDRAQERDAPYRGELPSDAYSPLR
ncbi:beta N-acetyl-glucosaminidase [Striga asiatica]|uniref:Beta N-acetyl-glucosaminidase n=1 Tax=Striga asiatica TaxID=4170 RepID=A0A5A7R699_STRAF|nr:beta N-acetyl-glucosaminidase [Striga asiatica]